MLSERIVISTANATTQRLWPSWEQAWRAVCLSLFIGIAQSSKKLSWLLMHKASVLIWYLHLGWVVPFPKSTQDFWKLSIKALEVRTVRTQEWGQISKGSQTHWLFLEPRLNDAWNPLGTRLPAQSSSFFPRPPSLRASLWRQAEWLGIWSGAIKSGSNTGFHVALSKSLKLSKLQFLHL